MKKENKYILKSGVLIFYKGKPYTTHNITDVVARAFLKENENRKILFLKIPKGRPSKSETDAVKENKTNETK